jgi:threonine/homoserine/homoserine lactone efflux protein
MALLLFASALGLGQLVLAQTMLLKVLNWGGAAFLLWLAWKIANAGGTSAVLSKRAAGFFEAAGFQCVNPKGWLVAVSAAGTYSARSGAAWGQAITFGAVFFAAALPSGLLWLALGATLHRLLQDERAAHVFNIVMGLALAASVVLILC